MASGVTRQPTAGPAAPERFPFDTGYQQALLRLLCQDEPFARAVGKHLKPTYFEGEVLQWAYALCQRHYAQYGVMPTVQLLVHHARGLDQRVRPLYTAVLEQVAMAASKDDPYLKDRVLDFVKRNVFVRAYNETRDLYNSGKTDQAYDMMMREMERIQRTTWEEVDRSDFFGELPQREHKRVSYNASANSITSGFSWLDHILSGGLSLGEVGMWLAYPKVGKSTMLVQHGVACPRYVQKNCLYIVLEGARAQTETRLDAAFSLQMYNEIKNGGFQNADAFTRLSREYQAMRGMMYVRGFTERWDYTVEDIQAELDDLKATQNWRPSLIILDYVDLLSGRKGPYRSEHDKQRDAVRDVKSLANRGYAIWTATQAQRPKEEQENIGKRLYAREIADCYDKVRVCDFIGSLNQTMLEKEDRLIRAYAELYRDNAANVEMLLRADYSHMSIREEAGLTTRTPTQLTQAQAELGKPKQLGMGF